MGFFDDLSGKKKGKDIILTHHTLGEGWTSDANLADKNVNTVTKWYNDLVNDYNTSLEVLTTHEDNAFEWWQDIYWANDILNRIMKLVEWANGNENAAANSISSLNETINNNNSTIRQNDNVWIKNNKLIDLDHWSRNHKYNKTNDDCRFKIDQYQSFIDQWNLLKGQVMSLTQKIANFKNKAVERYHKLMNKEYNENDFIEQYKDKLEKEEEKEKQKQLEEAQRQAEKEERERIEAANRRPFSELLDQFKQVDARLDNEMEEGGKKYAEELSKQLAEAIKNGDLKLQKKILKKINKLNK